MLWCKLHRYGNYWPLCIRMTCRNHLREVNHCYMIVLIHHNVELVKVTMYESVISKLHNQLHTVIVHGCWVRQLSHLDASNTISIKICKTHNLKWNSQNRISELNLRKTRIISLCYQFVDSSNAILRKSF